MPETHSTGATRDNLYPKPNNFGYPTFPYRIDLIKVNDVATRRLAYTLGEGSSKYGDKNWMKGFKESMLLAHFEEHQRKFLAGDRSEDHLAHMVWNINTLMYVEENHPEMMDVSGSTSDLRATLLEGPKL